MAVPNNWSTFVDKTYVGYEGNTAIWWTAFSDYYVLEPNTTQEVVFTNYSAKDENWHNWNAYITTDADRGATGYSEYFRLRNDHAGEGTNWNGSNLTSYFEWGDGFATFRDAMDGATVKMKITREGAKVTIRADIKGSDGEDYWEYYYCNCGDGNQNIRFFLTTELGHLVMDDIKSYNYPTCEYPAISAAGYATYSSNNVLDFSTVDDSKLVAYTATATSSTVTFNKVTGSVPAGTGLLLRSVSGEAIDNVGIPVATSSATDVSANALKANLASGSVTPQGTDSYYALNSQGEPAVVAFYKFVTAKTLRANSAYLVVPTGAGARSISLPTDDEESTGINAISEANGENDGAAYNLSGQKVGKSFKGLLIKNGRKFIVK